MRSNVAYRNLINAIQDYKKYSKIRHDNKDMSHKQNLHLLRGTFFLALRRFTWKKFGLDKGNNTALADNNVTQQLVQFFVIADGELEMARDYTLLLVVAGSIASELQNLSGEILQDCSKVDRCPGSDTLSIVSTLE